MKKARTLVMILCIAALVLSMAGCGGKMTPETLVQKMTEATAAQPMSSAKLDVVMDLAIGVDGETYEFAIELDGKEHFTDAVVRHRDRKKAEICREHGFDLIRIENTYARRYHYIKEILTQYFARV